MITHSIRTSKYKTKIDIPAQKLQTRSKFIQISKGPVQQQTITFPNPCWDHDRQKIQMNLDTKLVIQQLQKAYNQDMMVYQEKLRKLQTQSQIQRLKLQNLVQYQRKQIQIYKLNTSQSEQRLNKVNSSYSNQVSKLQLQIKNNYTEINSNKNLIQQLQNKVRQLSKSNQQKSQLLSSRFKQLEVQKQKIYREQKILLTNKIDNFKRQSQDINLQLQKSRNNNSNLSNKLQSLERQHLSLKDEESKLKQLNQFQSQQIEAFIKNIKDLENDKQNLMNQNMTLQRQIKQQNISIQQLIQEMRSQKQFIQRIQSTNNQDNQFDMISRKLGDYQSMFGQKQNQLIEQKSLYLLKLQQLDKQRLKSNNIQQKNLKLQSQIQKLTIEITKISKERDDIGRLLTTKTLQYNQLLSRPPEQKVYEVKIQKTIQKKQYIEQLQSRISQYQKIIEKLKEENQSIVQQVKKSVLAQRQGRNRQKILQSSVEELKSYIATNQNRLAWSVSRQIAKDIQINKESSQKSNGYKVFVKQHQSSSSHSQQLSDINKNEKHGLNFSVQSKLESILKHKQGSSILNKSNHNQQ